MVKSKNSWAKSNSSPVSTLRWDTVQSGGIQTRVFARQANVFTYFDVANEFECLLVSNIRTRAQKITREHVAGLRAFGQA